jgi:hypothetical protein
LERITLRVTGVTLPWYNGSWFERGSLGYY